mgnify:CR=1 FL=1
MIDGGIINESSELKCNYNLKHPEIFEDILLHLNYLIYKNYKAIDNCILILASCLDNCYPINNEYTMIREVLSA